MSLWSWIRRDGLLHIESCALIVIVLGACLPLWAACLASFGAGIVKELYDREHGGVASWHDLICDLIGIGCSVLFLLSL